MSLKRINVYADSEDLAIIKEAARRRGVSEAEIIRQGIHLAAMANRVRHEQPLSRTLAGPGRTASRAEVRDAVADAVRRQSGPRSEQEREPESGWGSEPGSGSEPVA
ncbi:CopG family transcriptional regulator [Streptomyces bobili]|uniref:ribbon-helix-helix domain-containing protein n=1 Tax=Streptomyces bobili TaxID=67280 RepID=UPI0036F5129A